ncbi:MAG: Gx transporter family protein [Firmicutes bacterium]|nr:Gx transporter family protein [Bacillota bacterium]
MTVKRLTRSAFLLALIMVLSFLESMLPPVVSFAPGIRLGLGNIVTMYALFTIDKKTAFLLNILKSVFVFITRGATAAALSLTGGILSLIVIIVLSILLKERVSYLSLSILGAVFHNIGQLAAISVLMNNKAAFFYLPVLIVAGTVMGSITGTVLNVVMPRLDRIK